MRLGVFGGSFDPPHRAHVLAAEHVLASGEIDRLLILPVYGHAFGKRMESFEHRVALCEIAFGELPEADRTRVVVSRLEAELPAPSYTLHTLLALKARCPEAELRLVVGADVLRDHGKWYRWDDVIRLAPLLPLGRVGVASVTAPSPVLPDISSTEVRAWLAARAASELLDRKPRDERSEGPKGLLQAEAQDRLDKQAQAAEARQRLLTAVPEKVLAYIDEHGLYR